MGRGGTGGRHNQKGGLEMLPRPGRWEEVVGGQGQVPAGNAGQWSAQSHAEIQVLRCPTSTHCSPGSWEATPHTYLLLGLKATQGTGKGSSVPTESSGQNQVLTL